MDQVVEAVMVEEVVLMAVGVVVARVLVAVVAVGVGVREAGGGAAQCPPPSGGWALWCRDISTGHRA